MKKSVFIPNPPKCTPCFQEIYLNATTWSGGVASLMDFGTPQKRHKSPDTLMHWWDKEKIVVQLEQQIM